MHLQHAGKVQSAQNVCYVAVVFAVRLLLVILGEGWGCGSFGRASDRHAVDAALIPQVWRGIFLPESTISGALCAIAGNDISVHTQDPVVHVRVLWIVETLKHPACAVGWVVQLFHSCLSLGKTT